MDAMEPKRQGGSEEVKVRAGALEQETPQIGMFILAREEIHSDARKHALTEASPSDTGASANIDRQKASAESLGRGTPPALLLTLAREDVHSDAGKVIDSPKDSLQGYHRNHVANQDMLPSSPRSVAGRTLPGKNAISPTKSKSIARDSLSNDGAVPQGMPNSTHSSAATHQASQVNSYVIPIDLLCVESGQKIANHYTGTGSCAINPLKNAECDLPTHRERLSFVPKDGSPNGHANIKLATMVALPSILVLAESIYASGNALVQGMQPSNEVLLPEGKINPDADASSQFPEADTIFCTQLCSSDGHEGSHATFQGLLADEKAVVRSKSINRNERERSHNPLQHSTTGLEVSSIIPNTSAQDLEVDSSVATTPRVLSPDKAHISHLPEELLEQVFSNLEVGDRCKARATCRRWRQVLAETREEDIWIRRCEALGVFPDENEKSLVGRDTNHLRIRMFDEESKERRVALLRSHLYKWEAYFREFPKSEDDKYGRRVWQEHETVLLYLDRKGCREFANYLRPIKLCFGGNFVNYIDGVQSWKISDLMWAAKGETAVMWLEMGYII